MNLQEGLTRLGFQFVPFLLAVVAHEFGHGFMASLWGDHTAKEEGRLTLNPIPHLDPIGTVLFPIIGMVTGIPFLFGWAKPVPIDPRRFRKFRPGLFWVSAAGPLANAVTAFICALGLVLLTRFAPPDFSLLKEFSTMLYYGIFINFALGLFNLIPLPPLDGSKIIESFLSYPAQQKYERLSQYSFFILMGLLLTGALQFLGGPIESLGQTTLALAAWLGGVQM
jgi:Zn-dependent protease